MHKIQVATVVALLLLAGCRTYGGHDSEALTAEALQQVVSQITESAEVAKGELSILEDAAQADPALASLAGSYASLVEKHTGLAEKMGAMEEVSRYRDLNRGLGAAISELYILQSGYQKIKEDAAVLRGVDIASSTVPAGVSYEAVPPYYRRIKLASDVSMRTALGLN